MSIIASLSVILITNPSITSRSFTKPTVPSKAFSNSLKVHIRPNSACKIAIYQTTFYSKNFIGYQFQRDSRRFINVWYDLKWPPILLRSQTTTV